MNLSIGWLAFLFSYYENTEVKYVERVFVHKLNCFEGTELNDIQYRSVHK